MHTLDAGVFYESILPGLKAQRVPSSAMFELTYGCNFRCVHCNNPTHRARPEELSTAEACRVLDEVAELGVFLVTFTGGELFTRPDVLTILEHAKRVGLIVDIFTNASLLTDELVARLNELGVREISVSIYGASEETFDRVTGVRGSYRRFVRGLQALSHSTATVTVRIPLMTLNVHEVDAAKAFVEGMGFIFRFFLEIEPGQNGDLRPLQYRLDPQAQIDVLRNLRPDALPAALPASSIVSDEFLTCDCGKDRFAITPYGQMNLCVSFPIPRYDVRTGTIRDGWKVLQDTARNAKPNEHDECPSCDLKTFCYQGRADAWLETGDMSVCLPNFKELAARRKAEATRGPAV